MDHLKVQKYEHGFGMTTSIRQAFNGYSFVFFYQQLHPDRLEFKWVLNFFSNLFFSCIWIKWRQKSRATYIATLSPVKSHSGHILLENRGSNRKWNSWWKMELLKNVMVINVGLHPLRNDSFTQKIRTIPTLAAILCRTSEGCQDTNMSRSHWDKC